MGRIPARSDEADGDGGKRAAGSMNATTLPLLVDRKTAARMQSISTRALDYLIAGQKLSTRRIGARVLAPVAELNRFVRADHPEPVQSI